MYNLIQRGRNGFTSNHKKETVRNWIRIKKIYVSLRH